MKVVYDGPQPSRTLEVGGSKQITIERGKPFEVSTELGKQLVEQRHFSATKATKATTKESE